MLPGQRLAVHTADVRQTVALTCLPDGFEWAARSPVVLSRGWVVDHRAGTDAPPALADRFRIRRVGASDAGAVDVHLERDVPLGPWLPREGDVGVAASAGVPLTVVLYVPLWLVNASHLAVSSVLVPMQLAPSPSNTALVRTSKQYYCRVVKCNHDIHLC